MKKPLQYRKKPVIVEAIQYTGDNGADVCLFVGYADRNENNQFVISTLEGKMLANPGDFIIKGVQGEFYPCKPDVFEQTYDLIREEKPASAQAHRCGFDFLDNQITARCSCGVVSTNPFFILKGENR